MAGNEAALNAAGYTLNLMDQDQDGAFSTLLRKARSGDLDAFEEIIRMHEKQVFRLAYRLLGNVADAQDAAQEVFLKLHRSIGTFDELRDFKPWLNRVTANACTDLLRGRRVPVSLDVVANVSREGDPERALSSEERSRLLNRGIEQLPAMQRAAIVLRDIEGLSTGEVAHALGSSEATVRSHISAGRVKLRSLLSELSRGRS